MKWYQQYPIQNCNPYQKRSCTKQELLKKYVFSFTSPRIIDFRVVSRASPNEPLPRSVEKGSIEIGMSVANGDFNAAAEFRRV